MPEVDQKGICRWHAYDWDATNAWASALPGSPGSVEAKRSTPCKASAKPFGTPRLCWYAGGRRRSLAATRFSMIMRVYSGRMSSVERCFRSTRLLTRLHRNSTPCIVPIVRFSEDTPHDHRNVVGGEYRMCDRSVCDGP